ncbi:MAG: T9SS type A sorting domain-containing protein [candidate division WOR-3 bacterium]|nr:T9SS type A sorting domain-containing protein [candidate division WOR-3 bacterium]
MNAGKGLYIENPDLGYAHSGTQLYQMLGATYLGDGNPYSTGNVQSVTGQPGTFVAGMSYNYMYQQIPDNYVDYIGSNGGTILFRSQENYGRVICYSGTGNTYRSIYSTFNLGALRNGAYTKLQLVQKYMEYLLRIGIEENSENMALKNLTLYPNPSYDNIKCNFALKTSQHLRINIFDATGRIIRTIADKEFSPDAYEFIWNGCDNSGKKVSNGTYIFVVETEKETIARTAIITR